MVIMYVSPHICIPIGVQNDGRMMNDSMGLGHLRALLRTRIGSGIGEEKEEEEELVDLKTNLNEDH